jgi:hypothetical protein
MIVTGIRRYVIRKMLVLHIWLDFIRFCALKWRSNMSLCSNNNNKITVTLSVHMGIFTV